MSNTASNRLLCPAKQNSNEESCHFEEILIRSNGKDKYLNDSCYDPFVRKDSATGPEKDEKHDVIEISDSDSDDFIKDMYSDDDDDIESEIETEEFEIGILAAKERMKITNVSTTQGFTITTIEQESVDCVSLPSTSSENEDNETELLENGMVDISIAEKLQETKDGLTSQKLAPSTIEQESVDCVSLPSTSSENDDNETELLEDGMVDISIAEKLQETKNGSTSQNLATSTIEQENMDCVSLPSPLSANDDNETELLENGNDFSVAEELQETKNDSTSQNLATSTIEQESVDCFSPATPKVSAPIEENFQETPPSPCKRQIRKAAAKCNELNRSQQYDIDDEEKPKKKTLRNVHCSFSCLFACNTKFDNNERQKISDSFWNLNKKSKDLYYAQYTKRVQGKHKYFNYHYFFPTVSDDKLIQVCSNFFYGTLNISPMRVQWFYNSKNSTSLNRTIQKQKIEKIKRYSNFHEQIDKEPKIVDCFSLASTSSPNPKFSSLEAQFSNPSPAECKEITRDQQNYKECEDIERTDPQTKSLPGVQCTVSCEYSCDTKFNSNQRQNIHHVFWNLNKNSKDLYYSQFTKRTQGRHKYFTYQYFFPSDDSDDKLIQVCANFFLRTLNISPTRIQWFYKNKHRLSLNGKKRKQKIKKLKKHSHTKSKWNTRKMDIESESVDCLTLESKSFPNPEAATPIEVQSTNYLEPPSPPAAANDKDFVDIKGNLPQSRSFQRECPSTCTFSCHTKFDTNQRKNIHHVYWNWNIYSKDLFFAKHTKRTILGSRKYFSYQYFFPSDDSDDKLIQVCANFFTKTLDISPMRLQIFYKSKYCRSLKGIVEKNKTEEVKKQRSFDGMETQNCKNNTESQWNTNKMKTESESVNCLSLASPSSPNPEAAISLEVQSTNYLETPPSPQAAANDKDFVDIRGYGPRSKSFQRGECPSSCSFSCHTKFNINQSQKIHQVYWNWNKHSKDLFFAHHTKRTTQGSRKYFVYQYFFPSDSGDKLIQVCSSFFTKTLDVSPMRIQLFYKSKHRLSLYGTVQKHKTEEVKKHSSFDGMETQNCRNNTGSEAASPLEVQSTNYLETPPSPQAAANFKKFVDIKGKCPFTCIFSCDTINSNQRQKIHNVFWNWNKDLKDLFFAQHTKRTTQGSRKYFSYQYFFPSGDSDDKLIQVCANFFLRTLDISAMRIQMFYKSKNCRSLNGTTQKEKTEEVKKLNSFDGIEIETQNCKNNTESHRNTNKMDIDQESADADCNSQPSTSSPSSLKAQSTNCEDLSLDAECEELNQDQSNDKKFADIEGNAPQTKSLQCPFSCIFSCYTKFTTNERQKIHDVFWNLNKRSKDLYYAEFTKKFHNGQTNFSYQYFFPSESEDRAIQVCPNFFLKTLNIGSKQLEQFYNCNNLYLKEARTTKNDKEFEDAEGTAPRSRSLMTSECGSCVFACDTKFSLNERQKFYDAFCNLDKKSRDSYYAQFTKRTQGRQKYYSYQYFFPSESEDKLIQVCQLFFLNTLDISAMRIQWYYNYRNRYSPKKKMVEQKANEVKHHISTIKCLETHYCRNNRKIQYMGAHLNIRKLFNLYKKRCKGNPVSKHIYYKVVNEDFNLVFENPPKNKQCDLCTELKISSDAELSEIEKAKLKTQEENSLLLYMINRY